ncbi:MAG: hypothetical protein ACPIOQ_54355, partial [Promethearchaeia archaeon]
MLASGAHFGGLLVANCSATVPGIELGSKRLRRPGAGASFKGTWGGVAGNQRETPGARKDTPRKRAAAR